MPEPLNIQPQSTGRIGPAAITIDSITLRLIPQVGGTKGHYTTGAVDPDFVSLVVEMTSGDVSGFGECIPTSIVYGKECLGRSDLDEWQVVSEAANNLIGKDARQLGGWIPDELKIRDACGIVDALDFAMHDLVGKVANLPVWALLGPTGRDFVWGMPVVHTDTPDAMAENALTSFQRGGYRWLKLKPTGDLETDRETMIKIREKTTDEMLFFADPNYGLKMDVPQVIHYATELHKHGLMVLEDPIDTDWASYREIQQNTPVHLMLDEKARSPQRVLEIATEKCASYINIHGNWAGGFAAGLHKANIGHAAGLGVIIGSSTYVGIAIAAYQTLSSVLPSAQPCEQTNRRDKVTPRPIVKNPYRTEGGRIHIPDTPGLGIDVDAEMLSEVASKTLKIN